MKLYVAIDLFNAGAYRAPDGLAAEDYSHDRDFFYVVLQPMLIHGGSAAGVEESPSLSTYLDWKRATLEEPDRVTFAGQDLAKALREKAPEARVTPVPFPPDATLSFKLRWKNGGVVVGRADFDRELAAAGPFHLAANLWPEFAARNSMSQSIRTWDHLSQDQKAQLFDWAYGLMQTLAKSQKTQPEKDVFRDFFAHDLENGGDASRTRWEGLLMNGQPSRLQTLIELLWSKKEYAGEPRLQPPSFRYTPEEIRTRGAVLFPNPQAGYHAWLWKQLQNFIPASADGETQAARALGRLYGFGERLRWPKPQEPVKDLMVVLPKDENATDPWLVTNAHSLMGQVFRVGPILPEAAVNHFEVEELKVGSSMLFVSEAAEDPFESQFLALREEARSLITTNRRFSTAATPDPRFQAGRVWYLPRNARMQSLSLKAPGTDKTLFAVPGSLLDAIETKARVEAPPGSAGGVLTQRNPQPALLDPQELVGGDLLQGQRLVRVKLQSREVPLSQAAPGDRVYELALTGEHPPDELKRIHGLLARAGDPGTEIWIERIEGGRHVISAFPLAGKVLSRDDERLTVADPAGTLHDLLPKPPEAGAPQEARQSPAVDFVSPAGDGSFNLLALAATDDAGPLLVLKNHFEHRVSRSAERLLERFGLSYSPMPPAAAPFGEDPAEAHPITGHFANFNKLRMTLHGPEGREIPLHFPDAVVPLPPLVAGQPDEPSRNAIPDPGSPPHSYWVAHQFSEEIHGETDASEESHYASFLTAGEDWSVHGTAEHQYSHKVPLDGSLKLKFPLSTDARSLAGLSLPVAETAEEEAQRLPALTYDHRPGNPESIEVRLEAEYVQKALNQPGGPARLRPLYEALADFATGTATLRLERWNFDNTLHVPEPGDVADPEKAVEFPGVAGHLRFDGAATRPLTSAEKVPFTRLLGRKFSEFVDNLKGIPGRILLPALPLDGSWTWVSGGLDGSLSSHTNVIRLGLRVDRPKERAIGTEVAVSAAMVPLRAIQGPASQGPGLSNPDPMTVQVEQFGASPEAAQAAREELHEGLASVDSPVRGSFAWIVSDDADYQAHLDAQAAGSGVFDSDRGRKLFGESYPYLNFPTGLAQAEDRVTDLFYVPWAFRPLAAHPALGDAQTTLEFAEYLVSILAGVARGRVLDEVDLPLQPEPVAKAWQRRDEARQAIRNPGGVADKLRDLLARVEADLPPGNALFDKVRGLQIQIEDERQRVMRELLAADPSLFVTSKAIAVGIFDPGSFSDRLYSLEVTKSIRPVAEEGLPDKDADRFTFARLFGKDHLRFLVDVLDDKSYDNDFEIPENVYDPVKPQGFPRLASEISQRGASRARTGEDLVEQAFFFNEDPARPKVRSLEANVVHYNPEWKDEDAAGKVRRRYLLPSRRFPRLPQAMQPIEDERNSTRLSRLLPVFPSSGPVDLDQQFASRLNEAMPSEVRFKQGTGELVAVPEPGRRAAVSAQKARGWHHLDTYLSHYYFLVEADEEGEFGNDEFELYVERGTGPFANAQAAPLPAVKLEEPLQKWFLYHRRREEGGGSKDNPLEKPDAMPLGDVLTEIQKWLLPPAPGRGLLAAAERDATGTADPTAQFLSGAEGWALKTPDEAPAGAVGQVLAAELMEIRTVDGIKDPGKRVLHIAVLDEVWRYQRVRARVVRNEVDINRNQTLDINPAFLMTSPFSDWVDYGRDVLRLRGGADGDLPAPAANLEPSLVKLEDWLALGDGMAKNFGPIVDDAIRRTFPLTAGGPAAQETFWNAAEATALKASGVVLQVLPDRHPRQSKNGPAAPVPERGDELARQLLPEADLKDLTQAIRKDLVRTVSPWIRVTWKNGNGVPVLEVTWPVILKKA